MDLEKVTKIAISAYPAWSRMKEDQKRVDCFSEDWKEAFTLAVVAKDPDKIQALLQVWPALAMAFPTGFSTDPFKRFRLLADDFARALDFKRYKARRNLS